MLFTGNSQVCSYSCPLPEAQEYRIDKEELSYQFVLVQAGNAHMGKRGLCLTQICSSDKGKVQYVMSANPTQPGLAFSCKARKVSQIKQIT